MIGDVGCGRCGSDGFGRCGSDETDSGDADRTKRIRTMTKRIRTMTKRIRTMRIRTKRMRTIRIGRCGSMIAVRPDLSGANEFAATTAQSPPARTRRPGPVRRPRAPARPQPVGRSSRHSDLHRTGARRGPLPRPLPARSSRRGENSIVHRRSGLAFSLPRAVCGGGPGRGRRRAQTDPFRRTSIPAPPHHPPALGGGREVTSGWGAPRGRRRRPVERPDPSGSSPDPDPPIPIPIPIPNQNRRPGGRRAMGAGQPPRSRPLARFTPSTGGRLPGFTVRWQCTPRTPSTSQVSSVA
jgi:hypothetical protein